MGRRIVDRPGRRKFMMVAGALLAAPLASFARQPERLVRIGVLAVSPAANLASRTDALRAGLRDLGYVEGRNLVYEFRSAEGKADRLPGLAAELVRKNVDVIVVGGSTEIRAARQATESIPIVIAAAGNPVAGGLVDTLSRPGGNITGYTYFAHELAAKQLELLKETLPQTTRVAVIVNSGNPASAQSLRAAEISAKSLRLELEQFAVREPPGFEAVFAAIAKQGFGAALIIDDPVTISNARALANLALKYRLATGADYMEFAEAGGLMSYGVNLTGMWHRAAFLVDRILNGTRPADIPVERSTRFDFIVNRKTARAIGVAIAPSILLRADRVIE